MFIQLFFSNVRPILQTVSSQEVTLKACCGLLKSCMLGRKVIYVRCINCSYINVAKGIRLLDKKVYFVIQEKCRVHTRQGNVREILIFSRSGNCQGILCCVREK